METEIKNIINQLNLQPHPEGGYYKETYRSVESIDKESLNDDFSGKRNYSTAIYFMLTSDSFSAFHRINQDEIWHFYKGTPIKLHIISSRGMYSNVIIGNEIDKGQLPQYTVPGKDWFAAELMDKNSYALVGCTVAPGFDFEDFELPSRKYLISKFPEHESIIAQLTRN